MRLTARDRQIVKTVWQCRLLTSHQIEARIFPSDKPRGKRTVCQRRLQLLFHHRFLDRMPMHVVLGEGRVPYVYVLGKQGIDLVASMAEVDRAEIGWRPTQKQVGISFVNHALAINDVRIVLTQLADQGHFELTDWLDEADFRRGPHQNKVPYRTQGMRIMRKYPDGYFQLKLPQYERNAHFFLEVDQGTMSNSQWMEKVRAYVQFRDSRLSQKYYGTRNFRLLTVTSSASRLTNLRKATERAGGDHFFWFTTQDEADIWQPERFLRAIWSVTTKAEKQSLAI